MKRRRGSGGCCASVQRPAVERVDTQALFQRLAPNGIVIIIT